MLESEDKQDMRFLDIYRKKIAREKKQYAKMMSKNQDTTSDRVTFVGSPTLRILDEEKPKRKKQQEELGELTDEVERNSSMRKMVEKERQRAETRRWFELE